MNSPLPKDLNDLIQKYLPTQEDNIRFLIEDFIESDRDQRRAREVEKSLIRLWKLVFPHRDIIYLEDGRALTLTKVKKHNITKDILAKCYIKAQEYGNVHPEQFTEFVFSESETYVERIKIIHSHDLKRYRSMSLW